MATHYNRLAISLPPALAAGFKDYCRRKGMHVRHDIAALIAQDLAKDKSQVSGP
jgi:hypothetical protein